MKTRDALKVLAEVSEAQWGMVTTAQASARGVSHMNLSRLADAGDLVRLSHGVYKDAGAPGGEHEELRSAWLAAEPVKLAWQRLQEKPGKIVVSGESAAALHGIGNLRAMRSEFTTPERKQTQRTDVRFRTRTLTNEDVTVRDGLPVTTPERTVADLIEQRAQLDHVGDALRDAARKSTIDTDRLTELLAPLAERNGHRRGDGGALLEQILESARIDLDSLSKQIAKLPDVGALVARDYLASLDVSGLFDSPSLRSALEAQQKQIAKTMEAITMIIPPSLPALDKITESVNSIRAAFDSPTIRVALEGQQKQLAAMSEAINNLVLPSMPALGNITMMLNAISAAAPVLGADKTHRQVSEALNAVNWAALAQDVADLGTDRDEEP